MSTKLTKLWLWGVKHKDGEYVHVEGDTIEEAVKTLGWKRKDVKRYMPLRKRVEIKKEKKK